MAGIKIWVLTGDKQGLYHHYPKISSISPTDPNCMISFHTETAVNIGYSCQLLTDDLIDVFVVDGTTLEEVEKQLIKFKESVKIVNTFQPPSE